MRLACFGLASVRVVALFSLSVRCAHALVHPVVFEMIARRNLPTECQLLPRSLCVCVFVCLCFVKGVFPEVVESDYLSSQGHYRVVSTQASS